MDLDTILAGGIGERRLHAMTVHRLRLLGWLAAVQRTVQSLDRVTDPRRDDVRAVVGQRPLCTAARCKALWPSMARLWSTSRSGAGGLMRSFTTAERQRAAPDH